MNRPLLTSANALLPPTHILAQQQRRRCTPALPYAPAPPRARLAVITRRAARLLYASAAQDGCRMGWFGSRSLGQQCGDARGMQRSMLRRRRILFRFIHGDGIVTHC